MTEDQIRIFHAVAKRGSFSKAEEDMHISKQAMLKQVNALEHELNIRLFSRSRTGVTLTDAGELFQKGMHKISRETDRLIRDCRKLSGGGHTLRVGNVEHQALLAPVTQVFSARYPDVEIRQVIHPNHSGEWRVAQNIQDVAETFRLAWQDNPELLRECGYIPLTSVPYMAAMRKGHLLSGKTAVSLEALTRFPTMVFSIMQEKPLLDQIRTAFQSRQEHLILREDVDNQVPAAYECLDSDRILITANPFIEGIGELVKVVLDTGWQREYGILFREPASEIVKQYIDVAKEVYGGNDSGGQVP